MAGCCPFLGSGLHLKFYNIQHCCVYMCFCVYFLVYDVLHVLFVGSCGNHWRDFSSEADASDC